ncbi:MAG: hypothetical protein EKK54_06100 [Neisseriaceae bacterium]|nr:MAG: hypothetical protein EKK54_06100 [Neisseriaceae bacterium]
MLKQLSIATAAILIVACNGGGSSGNNPSPEPSPTPTPLNSLTVTIMQESNPVTNNTIDMRDFAISPIVNIVYTNTESFPIVLRTDVNFDNSGCGVSTPAECPSLEQITAELNLPNRCANVGQTVTLNSGDYCIQSFRANSGWNFTNSESLLFVPTGLPEPDGSRPPVYLYYNQNNPSQKGKGTFNLTLLVGITQNLGQIGTVNPGARLIPDNSSNYVYRNILDGSGNVGKYSITYDDVNHTAAFNTTPETAIPYPYPVSEGDNFVGIANNGDLIGSQWNVNTWLVNFTNKIQYGMYSPQVSNGYNDMFVGLDGENYAVNLGLWGYGSYSGTKIATFNPNESAIPDISAITESGNFAVTREGNIIVASGGKYYYCYMKSNAYSKKVLGTNTPSWITEAFGTVLVIGNKVYAGYRDSGYSNYYFGVNGNDCTIDWSDARRLVGNNTLYTKNNRVLFTNDGIGGLYYYPYSPNN